MPPKRRTQPSSPEQAALGGAIEQLREKLGITQQELADLSDMDLSRIGAIERGVGNPTFKTLQRLAHSLQVNLTEIARLTDKLIDQQ